MDKPQTRPASQAAFTAKEFVVCVLVIGVLVFTVFAFAKSLLIRGCGSSGELANMKQLLLATQQMALDRESLRVTNVGWPGDIGGTFSNWTEQIVRGGYLRTNDLCKLLSLAGYTVPPNRIPTTNTSWLLVYAVRGDSPAETVFLSSANFTNTPTGGLPPGRAAKPFGNKGFIVFRKGGDGAILQSSQAGKTNIVGTYAPLCR